MRLFTRLTIAISAVVVITVIAMGAVITQKLTNLEIPKELHTLQILAEQTGLRLDHYAESGREAVLTMQGASAIDGIIRADEAGGIDPQSKESVKIWKDRLATLFLAQLRANPNYLQMRFIGVHNGGREIVRLERTASHGKIRRDPESELQKKGTRAYFTQTIGLHQGNIFVSRIELISEHGAIQVPHVPVLHIATPVYDNHNKPYGIIVITIDMRTVLATIRANTDPGDHLYVINDLGGYVLHPDPRMEFNWQLGRQIGHESQFPALSKFVSNTNSDNGLLTLSNGARIGVASYRTSLAGKRVIKILVTAPYAALSAHWKTIVTAVLLAFALVAPIVLLIVLIIARSLSVPLANLTDAVKRYSGDSIVSIETAGSGEVRELASAFEKMTHDLARRRREEAELNKRLQQSDKLSAIGQLTSGIAHDINNLLTIIIGNLQLLERKHSADTGLIKRLRTATEAAQRCGSMIKRLLAFSRRQVLQPKTIQVNDLIQNSIALLKETLSEDIVMSTNLAANLWETKVDPYQLETALVNLAINARDAMPDGGILSFTTSNYKIDSAYTRVHSDVVPGDYVSIVVTDTGTGIPPDIQARVFEPFFTTKEDGKGTGLGLSMVHGFVKQSGGHIAIYSDESNGTSVKIFLPRALDEKTGESVALEGVDKSKELGGTETILLVEDEPDLCEIAETMLKELGYKVLIAHNPGEALELLSGSAEIDLLFTDIVMPGKMKGPELAQNARQIRPALPVLFTSGHPKGAIASEQGHGPSSLLLSKPYQINELAYYIRLALKSQGTAHD